MKNSFIKKAAKIAALSTYKQVTLATRKFAQSLAPVSLAGLPSQLIPSITKIVQLKQYNPHGVTLDGELAAGANRDIAALKSWVEGPGNFNRWTYQQIAELLNNEVFSNCSPLIIA